MAASTRKAVVPAQAGTHRPVALSKSGRAAGGASSAWIPAAAGMTCILGWPKVTPRERTLSMGPRLRGDDGAECDVLSVTVLRLTVLRIAVLSMAVSGYFLRTTTQPIE
jgi:hypothetical protein